MSFPRYSTHRPSGIDWLGDIPAHWSIERLKRICVATPSNVDKHSVEGQRPVRLCNYVDVYYHDRITPDLEFMRATATEEQVARFTLQAGDTVITKDSETADDIAVAAYVPDTLPGVVCGYHLSLLRPRGRTVGRFIKWLLGSAYVRHSFAVRANGLTRVGLSQYAIDNIELPCPPPEEQVAIATFLDRETAKLDALIAEQERLIELLAEKRQAAISHAVTKGMSPHASMKPSGIPWLGDVPAHWTICLLKRAFSSVDYGISDALDVEGTIAILRMGNIDNGAVVMNDVKYLDSVALHLLLRPGDLLYNRTNSLDLIGKVGMFDGNAGTPTSFASYLVRLRTTEDSLPKYFAYLLNTNGILGLARANALVAIGQCNLNPTRYGQIAIAFPGRAEQAEIVAFLDHETTRLDSLADEGQRAINLLQERRAALISAAVTGQIDVRSLAPSEAA